MKSEKLPIGHRRRENIPVVHRKISHDPMPKINTIEGEQRVMILKSCRKCKSFQPINNFYCKSASKRKVRGYDDNDPKSLENICVVCWDEAIR